MIKDVEILVAAHKDYWMPSDDVYLPIHVGAEGKPALKFVGDNTGDNISIKNSNYCELTGIYWYWKNMIVLYQSNEIIILKLLEVIMSMHTKRRILIR
jgi:hypothetical protein